MITHSYKVALLVGFRIQRIYNKISSFQQAINLVKIANNYKHRYQETLR